MGTVSAKARLGEKASRHGKASDTPAAFRKVRRCHRSLEEWKRKNAE
jgi:hypothetical protein